MVLPDTQNSDDVTNPPCRMGELEPWVDEQAVRNIWYTMGEQVNVKMIRDKFTGYFGTPLQSLMARNNAGYCFVDFMSPQAAAKALTYNGTLIPNTQRPFKLNWASGGGLQDRRDDRGPEFSIFVGDLGPEVTEYMLVSLFQVRYQSCKSAKIMADPMSGQSRGYGFVRFSDETERDRASVGNAGCLLRKSTHANQHRRPKEQPQCATCHA